MAIDPVTAIATGVTTVINKIFPDADAKLKAQLEQAQKEIELHAQNALAQIEVNKIEAGSVNWFIAGARPFVLWACGVAFVYATLLEPLARFVAQVVFGYKGMFPELDTNLTMQVLLGLLGLGAMRTYEKVTGSESRRS